MEGNRVVLFAHLYPHKDLLCAERPRTPQIKLIVGLGHEGPQWLLSLEAKCYSLKVLFNERGVKRMRTVGGGHQRSRKGPVQAATAPEFAGLRDSWPSRTPRAAPCRILAPRSRTNRR
ncbi:hypothetical protein AAFF_G00262160 [Aldrovandia affinis]|uniref:Uncharacterized protein n=1 Tax=Aldrovandia affinis TaxID=143900 RepID=A0AAD7STP6_9TELE|nr:hypothetical protein AAFF_G00262160 [Aldrovandia affinis]